MLIGYFVCSGVVQAILWSMKGDRAFKWNEHIAFVLERAFVFGAVWAGLHTPANACTWLLVIAFLWFPFFYNGAYYQARRSIDGVGSPYYVHGWFSDPDTSSTAWLNIKATDRVEGLLVGVLLFIVYLYSA